MQAASCPRGEAPPQDALMSTRTAHLMLHDQRFSRNTREFHVMCQKQTLKHATIIQSNTKSLDVCQDCSDVYQALVKRRYRGEAADNHLTHWDRAVLSWISDAPELQLAFVQEV